MNQQRSSQAGIFIAQYACANHAHARRCQSAEEAAEWIIANDGGWNVEDKIIKPQSASAKALTNDFYRTMMANLYWREQAARRIAQGFCRGQQSPAWSYHVDA